MPTASSSSHPVGGDAPEVEHAPADLAPFRGSGMPAQQHDCCQERREAAQDDDEQHRHLRGRLRQGHCDGPQRPGPREGPEQEAAQLRRALLVHGSINLRRRTLFLGEVIFSRFGTSTFKPFLTTSTSTRCADVLQTSPSACTGNCASALIFALFSTSILTSGSLTCLPTITLGIWPLAQVARLTRSTVSDILEEDYILAARSRGLPRRRILRVHALRPSMFSLITVAGVSFGRLIGGTVVVEQVFGIQGMGSLMLDAINNKDYRVVQASVLLVAAFYVVVNTVVDLSFI
jgi:hypothetical protein